MEGIEKCKKMQYTFNIFYANGMIAEQMYRETATALIDTILSTLTGGLFLCLI